MMFVEWLACSGGSDIERGFANTIRIADAFQTTRLNNLESPYSFAYTFPGAGFLASRMGGLILKTGYAPKKRAVPLEFARHLCVCNLQRQVAGSCYWMRFTAHHAV
jgi:hypothetical protein